MILYVRVNKGDRDRLLKWATEHTLVGWGSERSSPWPCHELATVERDIWLCCDEKGLFAILKGAAVHPEGGGVAKIVNPYQFCIELRKLFPKAQEAPKKKTTPKKNRQRGLWKGDQ